jgi:small conductance mechanosensitive channel
LSIILRTQRRVDMVFGCGYGDDLKKAKETLEAILEADDRILKDPSYTVAVSELADSSVNFVVRPWVKSGDYWAVKFDVTEAVKSALTRKASAFLSHSRTCICLMPPM